MPLRLKPLGVQTVHPDPEGSFRLENGPKGARSVTNFREIVWQGDRIQAHSKWANGTYTSQAGVTEVEVRAMFETHDGALVFMRYLARVDLAKAMAGPEQIAAISSGSFETSDERYAWLNFTHVVGSGRFDLAAPTMTYDVYALEAID